MLSGGIVCFINDAWFCDYDWFVSLQWVLVYCGSYICNNISCLVGFFFCVSHILAISLSPYLIKWRTLEEENEAHTNKQMLLPPSSCKSEQVEEKKTSLYFPFPPCSCYYSIYLTLMKTPNDQERWILKILHLDDKRGWLPTYLNSNILCLSSFPLFLLSSNLEMRFCLRGVDLSHPEISQFQDVNRKNN
jgi:hypothetical protein